MKSMKHNFRAGADFIAVTNQVLSAHEFLAMKAERPAEIKAVKFIAPRIGGKGFGTFNVEYRTPKLVPSK